MSSAVADLDTALQAMLALKPPGVSGSRINSITQLCTMNVQSESVLVQKLYTHFKKAPGTHKLGVLYVVDSVTRKWAEQAKLTGQPIGSTAQDGTFAAGVNRVKDLLPVLMTDITQNAPEDQKDKIRKLVDIWEKGSTFPLPMLNEFKQKLNTSQPKSTTPEGSPPPGLQASLGLSHPSGPSAAPAAPPSNTSSILEALANIARQNTSAPPVTTATPTPNVPMQAGSYNVSNAQNHAGMMGAALPIAPPVNVPAAPSSYALSNPLAMLSSMPSMSASNPAMSGLPMQPGVSAAAAPVDNNLQQKIQILQVLAAQGVPQDQWPKILEALSAPGASTSASQPPVSLLNGASQPANGWSGRPDESRDRSGYQDVRSPAGAYRRRSRSRSPNRWGGRESPNARRSYDDYGRERNDDRGRGRGGGRMDEYRQRSPPGRRGGRSPSPARYNGGPKFIDFDHSIGPNKIKVLSRTLFVGGVTQSESELRRIFERFGVVQTCIVNREKRHAFVKMLTRDDAVRAKAEMDDPHTGHPHLRTRWGVGFGPRDCSDYQTGISLIPISRLTDADRKWMLTAEFGGSGGKAIEPGLVVEEPDIEIGQGVSSKAISRRMQTDRSGSNGPRSGREHEDERNVPSGAPYRGRDRPDDDMSARHRRGPDRRDDDINDRGGSSGTNPVMPPPLGGFPYPLPGMPNMFANFGMPSSTQQNSTSGST